MVQIRVTPKTRNLFTIKALLISGVTWKLHFVNHVQLPHQVVKMIGLQPANRVDMDRFAADAGMVGMNASLRGIQGGTGAMLESATKAGRSGEGGGTRALADGSRSAENGGPKLLGNDSTLQAASEVTPPAVGKGGARSD